MKNLKIEGERGEYFIPAIDFNAETGYLSITGESYLEDTVEFYSPILAWIRQYSSETKLPINLNIHLTYFNTSSSRSLLDILELLKEYSDNGGMVIVKWHVSRGDFDMREEIEDFSYESGIEIDTILIDDDTD